jgi:gliding motility-associated-like protein
VTDSGCSASSISDITVFSIPVANINVSSNCLGDTTRLLDISGAGNDSLISWNWSMGDGTISVIQNNLHLYSQPGNYPVQMIVTSIHGCKDTVNDNVSIYPIPLADAGPDSVICSGTDIVLGSASQTGITYQWSPSANLNQTNTSTPTLSGINHSAQTTDVNYFVTTTNAFGCNQYDTVKIRVLPVPNISLSAPDPQCLLGNAFIFTPIGYLDSHSVTYWNFGNDASPPSSSDNFPLAVSYSTTGDHLVTLSYSYMGCPGAPVLDTVTVLETPINGFAPSAFDGCMPLTVIFYNSHPDIENTYTWIIEGQTLHEMNPEWTFNSPGTYPVTLTVSNESGCVSLPASTDINVYPIPEAAYTNSPDSGLIYASLIEFQNTSIGAVQYEWNFGDGTTEEFVSGSHTFSDTGTFEISLIAISINGCRDTVYGKLRIVEGFSFYVPNAVTPNDDGVNDYFQGYGTFLHSYEMWIFDRWGKMIYYTGDYNRPWDCRMHSLVQNDTYVYRIKVTDSNDKAHIFIGNVTVVR